MRRRAGNGCPITYALQMVGDKWTLLIVRELVRGPKRTMELQNSLLPISSRTLVQRLRDMENDELVERHDHGGNPPHVEYELTTHGRVLIPLLYTLRTTGIALGSDGCTGRRHRAGTVCPACPDDYVPQDETASAYSGRSEPEDSIVLL